MLSSRPIVGFAYVVILLGAACGSEQGPSDLAVSSAAAGGAAGAAPASAGSGGHLTGGAGGSGTTTGPDDAGNGEAGSAGGSSGGRGGEGGGSAGRSGGSDASLERSTDSAASSDASFIAQCLPDGNGRLRLVTAGALALDVQQGNNADCSGGHGPLNVLNGTGYTLGIDAPLRGDIGTHLDVFIAVPNALQGAMGAYDATVQVQTYSDAVRLSDAKQWTGNCTINVTMNQKIATTPAYWTYEVAGSVTCTAPLSSKSIDGGPGIDAPLQVMTLDFVTQITWT